MEEERCAFCAGSGANRRRLNLSAILHHSGPWCTFLRTVWLALWRQLSSSLRIVYACRSCFQNLDTGANQLCSLQQSIATLEQTLASSGYYPLASRTTGIFASVGSPTVAAPPATEDVPITSSEFESAGAPPRLQVKEHSLLHY